MLEVRPFPGPGPHQPPSRKLQHIHPQLARPPSPPVRTPPPPARFRAGGDGAIGSVERQIPPPLPAIRPTCAAEKPPLPPTAGVGELGAWGSSRQAGCVIYQGTYHALLLFGLPGVFAFMMARRSRDDIPVQCRPPFCDPERKLGRAALAGSSQFYAVSVS